MIQKELADKQNWMEQGYFDGVNANWVVVTFVMRFAIARETVPDWRLARSQN